MDRQKANNLRVAFQSILDEAKDKIEALGVSASLGRASYSNSDCTFKLEFADIGENGVVQTREVSDFQSNATYYDLKAEDLGKEFCLNGSRFKITGCKPRSRKYPILGTDARTGKIYKFSPTTVKIGLDMAKKSSV